MKVDRLAVTETTNSELIIEKKNLRKQMQNNSQLFIFYLFFFNIIFVNARNSVVNIDPIWNITLKFSHQNNSGYRFIDLLRVLSDMKVTNLSANYVFTH